MATPGTTGLNSTTADIKPGALALLTPPERGLVLAIIQADRSGRGGGDLEGLSKSSRYPHDDPAASAQLSQRLTLLEEWQHPMERQQQ